MSKKETKSKSKKERKPKPNKKKPVETGARADAPQLDMTALADAPMLDTAALADSPVLDTGANVLGSLAQTADDETDAPASKKSRRKKESKRERDDKPEVREPEPAQAELSESGVPAVFGIEPDTKPEPLRLPRGAFVGLRKSGGLMFTTSEVVVYPDGRVAYDARGVPQKEYTRLRRVLNDGQTLSLRKLLDQTNFWQTESGGEQNPDGYAYEVAARLGQRSNEIEVFDGSLPESLKPLIERLSKLLPQE